METMAYKKLCEDLRKYDYWLGSTEKYAHDIHPKICDEAADAIEKLLLETHNLQVHADYCESERDAYKSEVERLKKQLEAAVNDICVATYHDNKNPCIVCAYKDSIGIELMNHCEECSKYKNNFKWRGEDEKE